MSAPQQAQCGRDGWKEGNTTVSLAVRRTDPTLGMSVAIASNVTRPNRQVTRPHSQVTHPNIVLFLQDDQDLILGGLRPLRKAMSLIADEGLTAHNWFAHTPVCCPSRAQLLSGRYFHNLRMPAPAGGCMHVQTDKPNQHSFATYLVRELGYTAGWLGKHMNWCPREPPPGYNCPTCRWFANGGAQDTEPGGYFMPWDFADFYGNSPIDDVYSKNGSYMAWREGAPVVDGKKAPQFGGYVTSIIANKSIEWLRTVASPGAAPFVLTIASKAPHYAATPAPWYEGGTWVDAHRAPRTASFGVTPAALAGHHALVASQGPLTADEERSIDRHFRKRWTSLLSVDDAIAGVCAELDTLGVLDTTYIFVTSDHGYNLGQHNLPSCKLQAYDHSIRVPMLIRGPGVARGGAFAEIATHVDLAPTFLALAGLDPTTINVTISGPPIDGKSLLPWLLAPPASATDASADPEHAAQHHLAELPSATHAQLERELARLDGRRGRVGDERGSLPPLREAVLIEYFSLGNLTVCGGGTCKGDREDPYGYCHMPCSNLTCPSLQPCYNATCCLANHTEFSSLEGMRCGAGHAPGSLPFNTSDDPGHQCDNTESNTYRALRVVSRTRGNRLYGQFTRLADWNFTMPPFEELFDLDADPGQLRNLATHTPDAELEQFRQLLAQQFACMGSSCS